MNIITDIHTHHLKPDAIVDIGTGKQKLPDGFLGSAGVHPWYSEQEIDWVKLSQLISSPYIVAIGECGLDALRGADMDTQIKIFEKQIELSELLQKPLILHCVRTHAKILEMHRSIKPRQEWIFHGFRLRPTIASDLLSEDINLSIGEHFNEQSLKIIPNERLFLETDESLLDIQDIASKISKTINLPPDSIVNISVNNIKRACKL